MRFAQGIAFEDSGLGRPVLFVHGWCMSSAVWALQRPAVAERHRFIALDLRGHGDSQLPEGGVGGFSGYADDIVRLAEHLDLQQFVAVGWSLGGQALLKAYQALQQRLAGLVLVGSTPRFSAAPHFRHGLSPQEAQGMRVKIRRNIARALEGFQRNLFADQELADPAAADRVAGIIASIRPPAAAAALDGLEALMQEELLEEAAQVTCPSLLIHGERDQICLPAASVWLAEQMPDSRLSLFSGCGHAPFLSRPELFNRLLLDFLDRLDSHV